jgi:hypothetical protein
MQAPVKAPATEATEATDERQRIPKGRTREAIDLMVFDGLDRDTAAARVGMKVQSLRAALHLATVKRYYAQQLDVLRSSERARNIHRLVAIRDAADNMPAVQAIKTLEQLEDEARVSSSGLQRAPGLQIVIVQAASPQLPQSRAPLVIDAEVPAPQREE